MNNNDASRQAKHPDRVNRTYFLGADNEWLDNPGGPREHRSSPTTRRPTLDPSFSPRPRLTFKVGGYNAHGMLQLAIGVKRCMAEILQAQCRIKDRVLPIDGMSEMLLDHVNVLPGGFVRFIARPEEEGILEIVASHQRGTRKAYIYVNPQLQTWKRLRGPAWWRRLRASLLRTNQR